MARINIYAIAREAGVSTATVSRVVSHQPGVKPETRQKVLAVVEKYNYRPNQIATGLLKQNLHTLCLVLPSVRNPFYAAMCTAAQRSAEERDYSVQLMTFRRQDAWTQETIDEIIGRRADGVILSGDVTPLEPGVAARMVAQLQRYMPVVVVNPVDENVQCPCLAANLAGSARYAVRHLHTLGHTRIALVGGDPTILFDNSREHAFPLIMEELGLDARAYPFLRGETTADGESIVMRLFSSYEKDARPTALIAFNDLLALGALKQLKRMGYAVPRDVALIGCDTQFFTPYLDPPLTTTDLHIESIVESAVQMLVQAGGQRLQPFYQLYDSTLIVRESCGASLGTRALG